MCGRYNVEPHAGALLDAYGILGELIREIEPRRNVKPGTQIPIISGMPELGQALWGYVPIWSKTDWSGPKPINARADRITGGIWRGAKRCLVPMSGFYEPGKPARARWKAGEQKRYYYFWHENHPLFAAGLMSGGEHATVTIITVEANPTVSACGHNRMPALLSGDEPMIWLSRDYETADVRDLLAPADDDFLASREVANMG